MSNISNFHAYTFVPTHTHARAHTHTHTHMTYIRYHKI